MPNTKKKHRTKVQIKQLQLYAVLTGILGVLVTFISLLMSLIK